MLVTFKHKWATVEYIIPNSILTWVFWTQIYFLAVLNQYIGEDLETESKSSVNSFWKMNIIFP